MTRLKDSDYANSQLQRARELLAEGQHQQAIVLALDALQSVLHSLRESLLNLQRNLSQIREERGRVKLTEEEMETLTAFVQRKSRTYH